MFTLSLPGIEEYAQSHTTAEPAELRAIADATRSRFDTSYMMVGGVVASLLQTLVHASRPRLVLEIGTFTGYSAVAMAAALPPSGRVVTCEADEIHAAFARAQIEASPFADRITLEVGDARSTIRRLPGEVDFVFIDADKVHYADYFEGALAKLSDHGVIAADNTLRRGTVLRPTDDPESSALQRFNDALVADARVSCVMLSVRDGVTLIRKARGGPVSPRK
jgi:caffeoyl-CoA O-methyltransferase